MFVFLSYPSNLRDQAEPIALSMRARGHKVFFDRDDLPPGRSYDDQIEAAIKRADAMVFLLSPESLTPGRYTLTELRFAQRKWPSPAGRVLPVMIGPAPIADVPAYLRAVTILEPEGSIAAEVAAAVDDLRRHRAVGMGTRVGLIAAGTIAVAAAAAGGFWYMSPPATAVTFTATGIEHSQRGFLGNKDRYVAKFTLSRRGAGSAEASAFEIVTEPPGRLLENPSPGKSRLASETLLLDQRIHTYDTGMTVSLSDAAAPPERWQLCALIDTTRKCTDWRKWTPGQASDAKAGVGPALHIEGTPVAVEPAPDGGFLVLSRAPDRLHLLEHSGKPRAQAKLGGEPTALLADKGSVFVGMKPGVVVSFDGKSLQSSALATVPLSEESGTLGALPSRIPVSFASDGANIWFLTRGGSDATGIFLADRELTSLRLPPYYEKVSFDLRDMHLTSGNGVVYGAQTNTTPTSLHLFRPDGYHEYGGHDFEAVSCATDVMTGSPILGSREPEKPGVFVAPGCNGEMQILAATSPKQLDPLRATGQATAFASSREAWRTVILAGLEGRLLVAVNTTVDPAGASTWQAGIYEVLESDRRQLLELPEAHIMDVAVSGKSALLVAATKEGRRQLITLTP